jgi:glutathione S-transferase
MIEVHHLKQSRSRRITWLLEELQLPYKLVSYAREPSGLAPPAMKAIHPLGKSPIIKDGDLVLPESGAIVEYIIGKYGNGRLAPAPGTPGHTRYLYWLHYAEGSAMVPLLLLILGQRDGAAAANVMSFGESQLKLHFSFIESELAQRPFVVGDQFTGADILMSFPVEVAAARKYLDGYPNVTAYMKRLYDRPAYKAAREKHGS